MARIPFSKLKPGTKLELDLDMPPTRVVTIDRVERGRVYYTNGGFDVVSQFEYDPSYARIYRE
jgi:hypothetical protein